jgi:cytochrome c5
MRASILTTLFLSLALLGCPGEPAKTETPADPKAESEARGKLLYAQTCAVCHGAAGEGMPNLGKDMTGSEFVKGKSDAELVEFIKVGRDIGDPANTTGVAMPPKGGNASLTDDQLKDLVAHIRTLLK